MVTAPNCLAAVAGSEVKDVEIAAWLLIEVPGNIYNDNPPITFQK